jgi:hypothetical protein
LFRIFNLFRKKEFKGEEEMNELLKDGLMILSGLIGGYLLILIRNKIFKTTKQEVIKIIPEEEKIKLLDLYNKGLVTLSHLKSLGIEVEKKIEGKIEAFSGEKLATGMLKVNNGVLWAKDIASIFNLRKLIIIGVIIGCIYGYGWYRGTQGKPVHFDMRGKEALIQLNEHYLKIDKDGTANVVDKDGKILKTIKVKDIDALRRALRPYGFILEPIVVAGGSLGESGAGVEAGAGISWFKWYKTKLDSFLTSKGFYPLGLSYSITDNSGIGLGAGIGFKGDKRIILYYKWRF